VTLTATVGLTIESNDYSGSGLSSSVQSRSLSSFVGVNDCTKVRREERTIWLSGADDINLSEFSAVKVLCVRNLSSTAVIGMAGGWNGTEFRDFLPDAVQWNFAPVINLGNLTIRGYPIRPMGVFLVSCPNSPGLLSTIGGSTLRIGGPSGTKYELYVMGV
jgi:hypothetical protein